MEPLQSCSHCSGLSRISHVRRIVIRVLGWMCRKPPNVGAGACGICPRTKQCACRKHSSCDTCLAEACPPKLRNTAKYRVEEMRPKWPFWKYLAPKIRLVEAQCAHWKHRYPEIPLWSQPTSRVSQMWGSMSMTYLLRCR